MGLDKRRKVTVDFSRFAARFDSKAPLIDSDIDVRLRATFEFARSNPERNDALWKKSNASDSNEDGTPHDPVDTFEMRIKEGVNSAHGLGALFNEIESRNRTIRFFTSVGQCLLAPEETVTCDVSGKKVKRRNIVVLPCGHCGCQRSIMHRVFREARCGVDGCQQQNVAREDVIDIATMLKDARAIDTVSNTSVHGSKLTRVVDGLKAVLQQDCTNRILVFCQLIPLMDLLRSAMREASIDFLELAGNPERMHSAMRAFKSSQGCEGPRVLLLSLDKQCSGANLTAANHIFFVHPVLQDGSRTPTDIETQAIGRARRYG